MGPSSSSLCTHFNRDHCRSCVWIDRDYSIQIIEKESLVKAAFPSLELEPTVRSSLVGFRNRVKVSVTGSLESPILGLLGREERGESLDQGRELLDCPIHHPKINALLQILPAFISRHRLVPYSIQEKRGELKGLIAFYSPASQEMLLRFVVRSRECEARLRKGIAELQSAFPELVCISLNIQPIPHAILEGEEEIFLTEKKWIHHVLQGRGDSTASSKSIVQLELTPQAFVQTNGEIAGELYATAARWTKEIKPKRLLELFCGQGAFSFFCAPHAEQVLGVEINEEAVVRANATAKALGHSHLQFVAKDAGMVKEEMETFSPDLVLVNPPRAGLREGVEVIRRASPEWLIYSSCSLSSLARDVANFGGEYSVQRGQIFDLFPHTEHFEILLLLKRNTPQKRDSV
jgi:23S rRNA (uracil747-C5)-methyltransferase